MYETRAYSSGFAPQRLWHRKRVKEVLKMAGSPGNVLDVGCGSCILLSRLGGKKYGIDLDAKTLGVVSKKDPVLNLCCGSALKIPFRDNTFDLVTCTEVLEHLEDPEPALKEICRVLRPGGNVVISTPNYRSFWPVLEWFWSKKAGVRNYVEEHRTHFTVARLSKALERAGFRIVDTRALFLFFPFMSMVSERITAWLENADDAVAKTGIGMLIFAKAIKPSG